MTKKKPQLPLAGGDYERTAHGLKQVGDTTRPAPGKRTPRKGPPAVPQAPAEPRPKPKA